jgi:hypothetical protein
MTCPTLREMLSRRSSASRFHLADSSAHSHSSTLAFHSKFIRQQCQLADELKAKELGNEVAQTQRMFEQYSAVRAVVCELF